MALLQGLSLRNRVTAMTIGLFVMFVWILVILSATVLHDRFVEVLSDQQLATTRKVAREIDNKLKFSIEVLRLVADGLPADLSYTAMQAVLEQRPLINIVFSGGVAVLGVDGKVIADYPVEKGRRGLYLGDRDYFQQVLATGQPYISKPILSRVRLRPVLLLSVPMFDAAGKVRAMLTGIVDLTAPEVLGFVSDPAQTGSGQYFVFSLRDHMIIAATDGNRAMTLTPARGRNLLFDRMADGFEGSGLAVSSEGITKLYSGVHVPTGHWLVLAALPTDVAFAPIRALQHSLYLVASLMTLIAFFVIRHMVGKMLQPLDEAGASMQRMTDGKLTLEALPVVRNDEIGRLLGNFNRLVDDRLQYEAALADSEQRFRLLVEGAPESILVQTGGRFVYANKAALALFGASAPEQLLGMPVLERVHPDCQAAIVERIQRVNQERQSNAPMEETYLRLDGSPLLVEVSAVPIRFGEEDGALVFVRDITERKRIERQLEDHQAHLENLVLQRTTQLSEALSAAKLADATKDEFLANITHELRTPLSAVIGFSSLASPLCADNRQRDYLDKVSSAGKTLSAIVDDLLDLSKIAAGRLEFENSAFSLRQIVARCTSVISYTAEEKGVQLVERIGDDVPDVLLGDALRVEQILLNLLSNAVKFTAAGRIELRIGLLSREAQRLQLNIEVEDSGIGLSEMEIAMLFKPFSQADASVTRTFGGTGLGLAICKRLAEMMDGEITVTGRTGVGSTFRVRLCLGLGDAASLPAAEESSEAPPVRYQDVRVLVIDDQPFNRDVVAGLLAVVGITPQLANNGQEALDILAAATAPFDLLLMDIQMPILDGLTATRVIRKLPGFERLPIIAMTAHAMAHEREKSLAAGMNDHLGKPFDEASFYRILAKWIPRHKQHLHAAAASPASAPEPPILQGVDTRAGLALLQGDLQRYRHWLQNFVAEAPGSLEQIRQGLTSAQAEPASMAAHSLKGSTGLLGMKELHTLAAALETAIDKGDPTLELLRHLEQGITAMCAEIGGKLGPAASTGQPAALPPRPSASMPSSVQRLIASLHSGDGDCALYIGDCLAELQDTAWAPRLRQALAHCQRFDFEAALESLADHGQEPA